MTTNEAKEEGTKGMAASGAQEANVAIAPLVARAASGECYYN